MNAPIARTTARTKPERVSAEVDDDGSSAMELCPRRSFKVKGWGTAAGDGMAGSAIMVTPFDDGCPRSFYLPSLTLTYLLPEQIGKNRKALPDDDILTIAQGISSVGAVVHISVDGVDPGERRVPATPTPCRCMPPRWKDLQASNLPRPSPAGQPGSGVWRSGCGEEIGYPLPPQERPPYDRQVAAARTALGDDPAFALAWQEGRALTLDRAVEYAMEKQKA